MASIVGITGKCIGFISIIEPLLIDGCGEVYFVSDAVLGA